MLTIFFTDWAHYRHKRSNICRGVAKQVRGGATTKKSNKVVDNTKTGLKTTGLEKEDDSKQKTIVKRKGLPQWRERRKPLSNKK
jgi:hypothetical protein